MSKCYVYIKVNILNNDKTYLINDLNGCSSHWCKNLKDAYNDYKNSYEDKKYCYDSLEVLLIRWMVHG